MIRRGLRVRLADVLRRVLSGEPAFFAVCCRTGVEMYVGRAAPARKPYREMGCYGCRRFGRCCWGPAVEAR